MITTKLHKYLVKNYSAGIIKVFVVSALSLLSIPIVVNNIGLEMYGLLSIIFIFSGIGGLIDFGTSKYLIVYLSGDGNHKSEAYTLSLFLSVAVIGLFGIIYFLVTEAGYYDFESQIFKEYGENLFIYSILLLLTSQLNLLNISVLESNFNAHIGNYSNVIYSGLASINTLILSFFSDNLLYFILGILGAQIVGLLFSLSNVYSRTSIRFSGISNINKKTFIIKSLAYFPQSAISAALIPLNKFFIISLSNGLVLLGVFEIALRIVVFSNNILSIVSFPLMGIFSNAQMKTDHRKILIKSLGRTFAFYILGCSLFYFFSSTVFSIINLKLIPELEIATFAMLLGFCLSGVFEPCVKLLMARQKSFVLFWLRSITLILNVGFMYMVHAGALTWYLPLPIAVGIGAILIMLWVSTRDSRSLV